MSLKFLKEKILQLCIYNTENRIIIIWKLLRVSHKFPKITLHI